MTLVHEVPTHLNVEDTLIFGLTPRQLLRISIGASLAYAVWDQTGWLPDWLRFGIAAAFASFGLLLAIVRPGDRALDQWLLAAFIFVISPRRRLWQPVDWPQRAEPHVRTADWAELSPIPEWLHAASHTNHTNASRPRL
jgi:PrgI family protein